VISQKWRLPRLCAFGFGTLIAIEYTPRGRTSTKVIQLNLETRNAGQVGKSVISFDELFLLAIPA